jgi:hypothetical protein
MYNMIRAAEVGKAGDPGKYRDFVIAPPPGSAYRPPAEASPAGLESSARELQRTP